MYLAGYTNKFNGIGKSICIDFLHVVNSCKDLIVNLYIVTFLFFLRICIMKKNEIKNRHTSNLGGYDFLVVHEGLRNYPELANKINTISADVDTLVGSTAHLADVALVLSLYAASLKKISERLFELHEIEKNTTLEEFEKIYP